MKSTSSLVLRLLLLATALHLAACSGDSANELVASGKDYAEKKEPRAAAIQFKAALQKAPEWGEARYLLGKVLLQSGDPVSAAVELSKALELKHPPTRVLPPLARALLLSGQTRSLTSLYGEVVLDDMDAEADLKSSLAMAWNVLGDPVRTEQAVGAALRASPSYGPALILHARSVAGRGKFDEALKIAAGVLAREPASADALFLQGEILWRAKADETGATAAFNQALASDNAHVGSHAALLAISLEQRNLELAKTQFERLKAVLPRHPQTRFIEAHLAFVQGDYKTARELLQLLLRQVPGHVGTLQMAGAVEFRQGSLLLAESHLNKALHIMPTLASARRVLAQVYLRLGQAPRALSVLQPLLDADATDAVAIAIAGEAFLQLKDPLRAEALFLKAAKINPDDPHIRAALALSHLARGDAAAAFAELEAVAAKDKGSFADMALISARLKRKEYDAALKAANSLALKQPVGAVVYTTRGAIQVARKDLKAARADFEKALSIDAVYFPAAAGLAKLDLDDKQPDQARKRFDELLRIDPRNHMAMLAVADIRARTGASKEELVRILGDTITAAPSEAAPRLYLIDLHLRNKDFKLALVAAQDALAALPNNLDVLDAVGRAQLAAGDLQQAVSSFRRLAGANPGSAHPHLRLADTYTAMRDKRAAENGLKRALEIQPDLVVAQRGLVEMALSENRPRDALLVAQNMQKQRPGEDAGYLFEGELHVRLNSPDKALAVYRLGLGKTRSPALASRLHGLLVTSNRPTEADQFAAAWERQNPGDPQFDYHLGNLAMARGNYAQAELRLTRVVAHAPDHALALNNIAWVLLKQGKPGALPFAEKANQLMPNRPPLMDTWAMALAYDNQLPRAMELQKSALARAPDDLAIRLNLARLAVKSGDKVLARTELEKLAALGKQFGGQSEVAELLKSL